MDSCSAPVVIGRVSDQSVVSLADQGLRCLPQTAFLECLEYTLDHSLASAHLSLVDSLAFSAFALPGCGNVSQVIPTTLQQALQTPEWRQAVEPEAAGLVAEQCFEPVDLPVGCKILPCIWVFECRIKARIRMAGPTHVSVLGVIVRLQVVISMNSKIILMFFTVVTITSCSP